MNAETKNIVQDLINKFVSFLNINLIPDVLKRDTIKYYNQGLDSVGLELDMNFTRDPDRIQAIESYVFDNIKGMNDEIAEKLRKELSQSLMNLESVDQMKERVVKVMDIAVDRATMIARTEMNRAENMGSLDAARQSGLTLMKEWDAHLDSRTSPVCRALDKKKIPLNEKFNYQGKEFDSPPAHPNCRSVLIYTQE
ncbi:minor capsid protein [Candidatus Pacearchaeota archaeon]|nr:minor capsid protein [Candidatus Pacearchaeota archaeon]